MTVSDTALTPPQATSPGARSGRIYTRVGDAGETSLVGKVRVWKDAPRINAYGTVDEATSALGMARATTRHEDICRDILRIQGELIDLMTVLATPPGVEGPVAPPGPADVQALEQMIDAYETERIATHHFIRPGGSLASAALDLARTIVRRAERLLVSLSRDEFVDPGVEQYLNRLSDLLYVMARVDEQREIRRLVVNALETTATPAQRDRKVRPNLGLATSDLLIEAGMRRAHEIGVPMVLAIVDDSGALLQLRRMDDALLVSIDLAPNKAKTAAAVRVPTHELAKVAQPGGPLYGIDANMPNLTLVGGGLLLMQNGAVVGAVGVSGGSVEQDIDVAQAMVAALA
jgi:ATP:cob(I)alamin adenosyltransferase